MALLSIIIPVFDQLPYTKQCIGGIFDTMANYPVEIIVVNNASAADTKSYLDSLAGKVKAIHNDENRGFSHACKQGAHEASGDFLLFLNNDIRPLPGWLEPMLDIFQKYPDAGIVGSKLLFPDRTIQHCGIVFPETKTPYQLYRGCPSELPIANSVCEFQSVTGACLLIPRSLFKETGGFDETYVNGMEDVDLCFKIQRRMKKSVLFCPQSVMIHYEGRSLNRQKKMRDNVGHFFKTWGGEIAHDDFIYLNRDAMEAFMHGKWISFRHTITGQEFLPPEVECEKVVALIQNKQYQEALPILEAMFTDDPYDHFALNKLGEISIASKSLPAAYNFYSKLLELSPNNQVISQFVTKLMPFRNPA
jgi:GT2 family glycosyltransferase